MARLGAQRDGDWSSVGSRWRSPWWRRPAAMPLLPIPSNLEAAASYWPGSRRSTPMTRVASATTSGLCRTDRSAGASMSVTQ